MNKNLKLVSWNKSRKIVNRSRSRKLKSRKPPKLSEDQALLDFWNQFSRLLYYMSKTFITLFEIFIHCLRLWEHCLRLLFETLDPAITFRDVYNTFPMLSKLLYIHKVVILRPLNEFCYKFTSRQNEWT